MGSHHPIRKTVAPEPTVIPDKLYFRIGDVARLCQVPAYVLRFWETEFPSLRPNKGGTGQRLYRKRDVEMALRIKSLLYDQGYTIPGARQVFKAEARDREIPAAAPATEAEVPLEAPVVSASVQAPPVVDMGELIRRRAQQEPHLRSLREDILALLTQLSAPPARPISPADIGAAQLADRAADPAANPGRPLRPRLVLEARPPSQRLTIPAARPEPLQTQQRDLFASELPEAGE